MFFLEVAKKRIMTTAMRFMIIPCYCQTENYTPKIIVKFIFIFKLINKSQTKIYENSIIMTKKERGDNIKERTPFLTSLSFHIIVSLLSLFHY